MKQIDAVISWVDGRDINYQKKLQDFCKSKNLNHKTIIEPTRINQVNEIYYCLECLSRNTPWLRNVYIITNQQIPDAIYNLKNPNFAKKIQIIDQNNLLKLIDINTPIFNSLSVEWLMWLIPDLSNNFLYLNDDFFITRPMQAEDFFVNGKIKLRGEWKTQSHQKFFYKFKLILSKFLKLPMPKPKTNPHRNWQEKAANLAGYKKKFYLLEHAPYNLNKNTFKKYIKSNKSILQENASRPFRDDAHISSVPLITHLNLINNLAINDKSKKAIMVNGSTHSFNKIKKRLDKASKNPNISFVCMQSIDEAPLEVKEYMLNWLEKQIRPLRKLADDMAR